MATVRVERCPDCQKLIGEGMLYDHQQRDHARLGDMASDQAPASQASVRPDAQRYYDALKRITRYQSTERLAASAERQYGLDPQEALEMAYDNIQGEAQVALHGKRRPKQ